LKPARLALFLVGVYSIVIVASLSKHNIWQEGNDPVLKSLSSGEFLLSKASVTNKSLHLDPPKQLTIEAVAVPGGRPVKEKEVEGKDRPLQFSFSDGKASSSFPSILQPTSTCKINTDLTGFLLTGIDLGWEHDIEGEGAPKWLRTMCPEVVDHFNHFPLFSSFPQFEGTILPVQTTNFAAQSVCTMKVVQALALSVQARIYLHAGSHLGAVIHGQPIPWDDDVDMWMDFQKRKAFMDACNHFGKNSPILNYPNHVELHCYEHLNAIKVWLQPEGMEKHTNPKKSWYSPFVDLFLFQIQSGQLQEVSRKGARIRKRIAFNITDYFPTRPFYFGGVHFIGPSSRILEERYALQNCIVGDFNHKLEIHFRPKYGRCIDCRKLYNVFPFAYDDTSYIRVGQRGYVQQLFPSRGIIFQPLTRTTTDQRNQWFHAPSSEKQKLTNGIPNLNVVEVDNTISPLDGCQGHKLKVIEFNAERGKRWLESAELLRDADVIILNEMDIGMARSDQQHTTRLMSYFLGMNYAWGLEFVELTLGDLGDRNNIDSSEQNFHGLHGNAILSKCKISNATIFRNQVGRYFSDERNSINANGLEKRLGGRMIMLGRIVVNGTSVVIGSTHKVKGLQKDIKEYIHTSPTVIAGDQAQSLCGDVGLNVIQSDPKHHTWPASCTSLGGHRGDNICSNLKVAEEEYTMFPCVKQYGLNISLGDHALTGAVFLVP
jgi:hypothetical protein